MSKYPKTGDTRIMEDNLLFPKTINGERRWWCYAQWEEMYEIRLTASGHVTSKWKPTRWIN